MALLISPCVVIENMKSENRKLTQKVRSIDIYILIKYVLIKRSKNEQPIVCKIMLQISVITWDIFICIKIQIKQELPRNKTLDCEKYK